MWDEQLRQNARLKMLLNIVRQALKHRVQRGHGAFALGVKQGLQRGRVFKQAVQVQAQHVAGRALPGQPAGHGRLGHLTRLGQAGVLLGLAMVNFITAHAHTTQTGPMALQRPKRGLGVAHRFVHLKHRHQRQQPQPRRIAVNAVEVNQGFAQHLQAAANAQHRPALPGKRRHRRIQPLFPQPGQVTAGVLGAGQHDPVEARVQAGQFGRAAHPLQAHAGQVFERLEFIQIADARVGDHRNGLLHRAGGDTSVVKDAVFFGQAVLPPHGQRGHGRDAGQVLQHLRRGRQQGGVATELVEHKAADQGAISLRQQCPGAVQVSKGAAPVDVGHQQASGVSVLRHPHVDDVAG